MHKPPPLPSEVLARVLRISAFDGRVLVFLAGGFAVVSAIASDWLGAGVGAAAAFAGAAELHGRRQLKAGNVTGVRWLVRSQLFLLSVILLYITYQVFCYDPRAALAQLDRAFATAQAAMGGEPVSLARYFGITDAELLAQARSSSRFVYTLVAGVTVLFQGGLAFYYHRKSKVIAVALRKT